MNRLLLLIVGICFIGEQLRGQEVHSSQFYSLPLFINPSSTGNSLYDLRAGVNYRNQWSSVSVPFSSQSICVDVKLPCCFIKGSWIGIGGMFLNDIAGEGLNTIYGGTSLAFHKSISRKNSFILSAGISFDGVNKSVDYQKLVFDDQWDGAIFNPSYETGDCLETTSLWYVDMDLGTNITYYKNRDIYTLGVSVNHIMQPSESFYNVTNNMARKWTIHGGVEKWFNRGSWMLKPSFVVDIQTYTTSAIIGVNFCNAINYHRSKGLIVGLWYRIAKEIIPSVGLQFDDFRVIASYDIPYSKKLYSNNGAFEMSLIYTMGNSKSIDHILKGKYVKSRKNRRGAIPCPKFK